MFACFYKAPPGTSDEHISIHQFLQTKTKGVLLVTTPQEMSLLDVRKEVSFCRKTKLPILGNQNQFFFFFLLFFDTFCEIAQKKTQNNF